MPVVVVLAFVQDTGRSRSQSMATQGMPPMLGASESWSIRWPPNSGDSTSIFYSCLNMFYKNESFQVCAGYYMLLLVRSYGCCLFKTFFGANDTTYQTAGHKKSLHPTSWGDQENPRTLFHGNPDPVERKRRIQSLAEKMLGFWRSEIWGTASWDEITSMLH